MTRPHPLPAPFDDVAATDRVVERASADTRPRLEQFIRTSITDPNAYTQPGFPKNVMPPFASLPKAQLDALVQYLIQSSKKG